MSVGVNVQLRFLEMLIEMSQVQSLPNPLLSAAPPKKRLLHFSLVVALRQLSTADSSALLVHPSLSIVHLSLVVALGQLSTADSSALLVYLSLSIVHLCLVVVLEHLSTVLSFPSVVHLSLVVDHLPYLSISFLHLSIFLS